MFTKSCGYGTPISIGPAHAPPELCLNLSNFSSIVLLLNKPLGYYDSHLNVMAYLKYLIFFPQNSWYHEHNKTQELFVRYIYLLTRLSLQLLVMISHKTTTPKYSSNLSNVIVVVDKNSPNLSIPRIGTTVFSIDMKQMSISLISLGWHFTDDLYTIFISVTNSGTKTACST